jgi:hypothetical protein
MAKLFPALKISSVTHTEDFVVIVFSDGREFVYPATILYSAMPSDPVLARRIAEVLGPGALPKADLRN